MIISRQWDQDKSVTKHRHESIFKNEDEHNRGLWQGLYVMYFDNKLLNLTTWTFAFNYRFDSHAFAFESQSL